MIKLHLIFSNNLITLKEFVIQEIRKPEDQKDLCLLNSVPQK